MVEVGEEGGGVVGEVGGGGGEEVGGEAEQARPQVRHVGVEGGEGGGGEGERRHRRLVQEVGRGEDGEGGRGVVAVGGGEARQEGGGGGHGLRGGDVPQRPRPHLLDHGAGGGVGIQPLHRILTLVQYLLLGPPHPNLLLGPPQPAGPCPVRPIQLTGVSRWQRRALRRAPWRRRQAAAAAAAKWAD